MSNKTFIMYIFLVVASVVGKLLIWEVLYNYADRKLSENLKK